MPTSLQRQRATYAITPEQVSGLKIRMLDWIAQFSIHLFLDSNNYPSSYKGYECLLAAGERQVGNTNTLTSLSGLGAFHNKHKDWLFGHISYDYKDELHSKLGTRAQASETFPHLSFFVPETVCYINREQTSLVIESFSNPDEIFRQINNASSIAEIIPAVRFQSRTTKEHYLQTIDRLRQHIAEGDCYEINYCTKGYCEGIELQPLAVFKALNKLSPAPFAAYYKLEDQYMMCASPERYLRKEGDRLVSQPIKGTARRGADELADNVKKQALQNSIKERAENVMIVDLVRNDLARSCEVGSVQVDELFGIYTYPQVHQMISTVSGKLKAQAPFTEAIEYSFPMGSMTGAPKHKVMQLIDRYETGNRGLFSGTVGYITPEGDFDFNVIIRSLFYDAGKRYLSYQTGGAITYDSDAEQEWEEMRLKAWALERIFLPEND